MTSFSSLLLHYDGNYSHREIRDAVDNYLPLIPQYEYHHLVVGFPLHPSIEVHLSPTLGHLVYSGHEEQYCDIVSYNPKCWNEEQESTRFHFTPEKPYLILFQYTIPKEEIIDAVIYFSRHQSLPSSMVLFDMEEEKLLRSHELKDYIY